MELVTEISDFINPLMWLSTQEAFIEFCHNENFKTNNVDIKLNQVLHNDE
jgi:hypothetical protein